MKGPEVVDEDVENAQNQDEQNGAELGFESDNNHDTSDQPDEDDQHAPEAPVARKDESNEEEDKQHATCELDVHLTVLFVHLGKAGWRKPLANPRVRQNHEETTQDGQVAEEEVEVENQAVSESLSDDDTEKTGHGILAMLPHNDEERRRGHGDYVDDQEYVGDARRDCVSLSAIALFYPPGSCGVYILCL